MPSITTFLDQYGYLVLFVGLLLEVIALPVPGELLMSYCGLLIYEGHLNWLYSIATAGLGSSCGMLLAYTIGYKLGSPFLQRYGSRIHLGPERLEKTSKWFARYGNKMIILAFFIPGVRHFTGYFAGITRISYRIVVRNALIGAFLWTGSFISLGKVLGPKWERYQGSITKYLIIIGILAVVVLALVYVYRRYKRKIVEGFVRTLKQAVITFHSLGKVKVMVVGTSILFLALFAFMIGLIQDYLAHEFTDFDTITLFVVHVIFDPIWSTIAARVDLLTSYQILIVVAVSGLIKLLVTWGKGASGKLELQFWVIAILGGKLLEVALQRIFGRTGPEGLLYSFPSDPTFMVLVVYGFIVYLYIRQYRNILLRAISLLFLIGITLIVGLNQIILNLEFPSDVVAGFTFGGVWLSLNVLVLEVFQQLKRQSL